MTARRTRLLVPVGVAAVVAATALSGSGTASASARAPRTAATPVPITHSNGLIAYSCFGYGGVTPPKGWVLANTSGQMVNHDIWNYGTYYGGVDWAPDGSGMVHDARVTEPLYGHLSNETVFVSEATNAPVPGLGTPFDYPWQDTNYTNEAFEDYQTTYTADGKDILFTRTDGQFVSTVELIPAAGWDPPIDLPQPDGFNSDPAASATGDIAFVNFATTGPNYHEYWIWLLPVGSDTPIALGPGTMPKFSPDGTKIAFVNGSGTLSTMNTDGSSVAAAGPTSYQGPIRDFSWSPDGTQFAVAVAFGRGVVETALIAAGSTPVFIDTGAGVHCLDGARDVSWQPLPTSGNEDQVVRVWGTTRQDTSVAASKAGFPTAGSADAVVLADSYHFPDALSGAPLATSVHGPMLLTPGSAATVWPSVLTEIQRVTGGDTSKPIYVLGETGSVSQSIEDQLSGLGYTVHRLGGINRYETSLAIANFMGHDATAPGEILLATGTDFPDGLSAGAAAASYWFPGDTGGAVLLTNGSKMYPAIQTYITNALAAQTASRHVYVTVVGGLADKAYAGTASNKKIRDVGADRYTTSAYVAETHFGAQTAAAVATGTSFPDALSGGAYAGSINAPLLLIPPSLVSSAYEFNEVPYFLNIASGAITKAYVFGGTGVISTSQATQLAHIIGINTTSGQITPTTALTAKSRLLAHSDGSAKTPSRNTRAPSPR